MEKTKMEEIDLTVPDPLPGVVFVYGSNEAGINGAGAARVAQGLYGAKYGEGIGRTGNAYAIPTKDKNIETLSLAKIEKYVGLFLDHARNNPDDVFLVTRIGCGLAGYRDDQIAPLFAKPPCNLILPWGWFGYVSSEYQKGIRLHCREA